VRHRDHARVEDRILSWQDCGLANLRFEGFARNQAWMAVSLMAGALFVWAQLTCLSGEPRKAEQKPSVTASFTSPRSSFAGDAVSISALTRPGRGPATSCAPSHDCEDPSHNEPWSRRPTRKRTSRGA
jgi:hypothetical protein